MKIAFASWDDRIAPVFDTARRIHVIETVSGQVVGQKQETVSETLPLQRVLRLVELGVDCLVCGAISSPLQALVTAYGIRVMPFVAGDLGEIIQAWMRGRLMRDTFAMPGCRGQRRRRFRGGAPEAGSGRDRGSGRGGPGCWVCPRCGQAETQARGGACMERRCPRCGGAMIRQ